MTNKVPVTTLRNAFGSPRMPMGSPCTTFKSWSLSMTGTAVRWMTSSEVACLSIKSASYLDYLRSLSSANCSLGVLVGSAVPATQAIYDSLKSLGVGFWLPGRQPAAFPPYIYSPIHLTLAPGTPQEINFDDEGVLAIGSGQ